MTTIPWGLPCTRWKWQWQIQLPTSGSQTVANVHGIGQGNTLHSRIRAMTSYSLQTWIPPGDDHLLRTTMQRDHVTYSCRWTTSSWVCMHIPSQHPKPLHRTACHAHSYPPKIWWGSWGHDRKFDPSVLWRVYPKSRTDRQHFWFLWLHYIIHNKHLVDNNMAMVLQGQHPNSRWKHKADTPTSQGHGNHENLHQCRLPENQVSNTQQMQDVHESNLLVGLMHSYRHSTRMSSLDVTNHQTQPLWMASGPKADAGRMAILAVHLTNNLVAQQTIHPPTTIGKMAKLSPLTTG